MSITATRGSARKARAVRLSGHRRYWDEERETMPVAARDRVILERVQHQLQYAYARLPFYRRHYDAHGFHPDQVKSLVDFTELVPVITKSMLVADQLENPPFGSYAGVERGDIARIHGSSGTTGTPTMYSVSNRDWAHAVDAQAAGLWCAGFRPDDIVQVSMPFSLFFGGWGALQALEELGAGVFPPGSLVATDRQIELIDKLGIDALIATPSYLIHLARRAQQLGYELKDSTVGLALVGGEPGGSLPEVRTVLRDLWGDDFDVIDGSAGSTSEMYPFLVNIGCVEDPDGGVHLFQDQNYTELVSADNPNESVPPGAIGATVATHLWRESQPMIRFWMGDQAVLDDSGCRCGRTYPKLPRGVFGRLDDMLIIRGANVYPSAIEAAIRAVPGAGTEFRIIVERPANLDELTVEVEPQQHLSDAGRDRLCRELEESIKKAVTVRVPVTMVEPGTHEQQVFKARRVIDRRGG